MSRYSAVRQCIYCGAQNKLTTEHIIPYGLGGQFELPEASCTPCATITGRFEGSVLRTMFGNARIKLNFPTRRRKQRPKSLEIELLGSSGIVRHNIPIIDHPTALQMLGFDTPRILLGHSGPDTSMNVSFVVVTLGADYINNIKKIIPDGGKIHMRVRPVDLGRMLAKIAHSYAVAELGSPSFTPLLNDFILGRKEFDGNYLVGGMLQDLPPSDPTILHELKWRWEDTAHGRFLLVGVRLFSCLGGPQHLVVAGRSSTMSASMHNS